ncbi:MAG: hypothetical protein ACLR23_19765 [Clostridia bacterium]
MEAEPGILFCLPRISFANVRSILGGLRLELGDMLTCGPETNSCFLFVDFPQFEYSEEEKRYVAMHQSLYHAIP